MKDSNFNWLKSLLEGLASAHPACGCLCNLEPFQEEGKDRLRFSVGSPLTPWREYVFSEDAGVTVKSPDLNGNVSRAAALQNLVPFLRELHLGCIEAHQTALQNIDEVTGRSELLVLSRRSIF